MSERGCNNKKIESWVFDLSFSILIKSIRKGG